MAARLSADGDRTVLVLEAGRSDFPWDLFIQMPAALTFPSGNRFYDWQYASEPEPHMNGRRISHARGKVLGGSSSINGMIFQRGNPLDYERWGADAGMDELGLGALPALLQADGELPGVAADRSAARATPAPWRWSAGRRRNPLFGAFFEAANQAGYPLTDDVNGYQQEGFAPFDRNVHHGQRLSASRAYLRPVMDRKNLTVRTRAMVTGIRCEPPAAGPPGDRRHLPAQRAQHAVSAGEVILCGGAINSPQLLQLAGIGPAEVLRPLGIRQVVDLPGVGANLQDHLEVYIQHACIQPVTMQPYLAEVADAVHRAGVAAGPRGRRPPTTSRAAGSSAPTTTSPTRT